MGERAGADPVSPALERVVARFAGMLSRVGARYRLSPADQDELVQEVRIRLWRSRASGELISLLGASYVYRAAITAALVVIRRRRVKTSGSDASLHDDGMDAAASDAATPETELASRELAEEVEHALESIPSSRATVVRLHLSGYSREEVAQLYGWSEGKTRNLLYRGLADLRAVLNERGIGPEARR